MYTHPHPGTKLHLKNGSENYEVSVKFNNFADGDTYCLVEETKHISGSEILIKHYLYPNQNEQIIRLLLLINTLVDLGAKSVSVFIPYMPYARQDKAHKPGESISSSILCRMLKTSGCTDLYTIDCHFMKGAQTSIVEGIRIHNTLVQDLLSEHLEKIVGKTYEVIGPDDGASYLANGQTMKKSRANKYGLADDGSIHRSIDTLDDGHLDITQKVVVVADDMVSTGGTMIRALENLKSRGVPQLYAMTTHGLFLGGSFEKIQETTKGIVFSDTIMHEGAVPVVDRIYINVLENYFSVK